MVGKVLRDRASSGLDDHEPTLYLIERDGPGRLALGEWVRIAAKSAQSAACST